MFGNYSGLASSDEVTVFTDGTVGGRNSPNVNRNFDLPFIGFSALGQPDNGRLPTDRPHAFKLSGAYAHDWSPTNTTEISGFTTAPEWNTSVRPASLSLGVGGQFLNGRGDLGRTRDLSRKQIWVYVIAIGLVVKRGIRSLRTMDILNLFDEANELTRFEVISARGITLGPADIDLASVPNPEPSGSQGNLRLIIDLQLRDRIFQNTNLSQQINTFWKALANVRQSAPQ